jgi:hypothetical protein
MNKKEIRAELRLVIDDLVEPYGWSNAILDAYLGEGMDKFCEDTGFFVDFNTYTITTVAGTADYAFDTDGRIMEILEVWNSSTGVRLSQFGQDDRPDFIPTLDVQQTTPYMWQADQTTGMVTLYPTPGEITTFKFRVYRYAKISFAALAETGIPEIMPRFHRAFIEYAAYKAYMHHDRERANLPKATDHLNIYKLQYVKDGRRAFQRMRGTHPHCAPSTMYSFR